MGKEKPRMRTAIKGLAVIVIVTLLVVVLIGANSKKPTVNTAPAISTAATNTSANPTSSTVAPKPKPTVAKVGDTVNIGGSSGLAVTLLNVFDPALGSNQFNTPDAGKRLVTADFKIANNGQSAVRGNADNNTIIIGSDNQTYVSDLRSVSECTDFDYSSYAIVSGASQTGCVSFQLPNGISVATVRFTPHSGNGTDKGEWTLR